MEILHSDSVSINEVPARAAGTTLQHQLKGWLQQWPWEVFASFTLKDERTSNRTLEARLRRWNLYFQKFTGLQTAYMGIIPFDGIRKHAHMLLLGRNRHSLTLQTCPKLSFGLTTMEKGGKTMEYYKLPWLDGLWPAESLLQPIDRLEGIVAYIAGPHNTSHQFETLVPYNAKLLDRTINFKEVTE